MTHEIFQRSIARGTKIASIDIGSHTARLLVSQSTGTPSLFRPLLRKRAYIRLAEGFIGNYSRNISQDAMDRAFETLKDFALIAEKNNAKEIRAVATGVVRRAENSELTVSYSDILEGILITYLQGEENG